MIHKAKKSLGQNFLKSPVALHEIIKAGEIKPNDTILEIGPGKGALTGKLLENADRVIAVEKDRELFVFLQEKFAKEIADKKLVLAEGDILNFNLVEHLPKNKKYKIIANIPYNITGIILKKFLTGDTSLGGQPESMILLLQYEVVKRIMAHDKKESLLSISVRAYGEPKMIMKVPARFFSPSPMVDSAVISITNISKKLFNENGIEESTFWSTVKFGFAHKRKKLSGNLPKLRAKAENSSELSILAEKRAENLSLKDWIVLVKAGI